MGGHRVTGVPVAKASAWPPGAAVVDGGVTGIFPGEMGFDIGAHEQGHNNFY